MLVIHWSKHNNTNDILKNGIRPKTRKNQDSKSLKGVWCYPFTRNKTLNSNWKRNLKIWRGDNSNFNGFVFKLTKEDFPIYAGSFSLIGAFPESALYESYEEFFECFGKHFSPEEIEKTLVNWDEGYFDYQDFEIILTNHISAKRIVKVIKDRQTTNSG